jgi:hypothetical protein
LRSLALLLFLAPLAGAAGPDEGRLDLAPVPPPPAGEGHAGETRCAACHTTAGWSDVAFLHDRTGFPLTGRHKEIPCADCHRGDDFSRAVARACVACHRDVHRGRLGTRCDGCHDAGGWGNEPFGAEAHRRTGFPLTGRHALLPCEECHGDRRDRSFGRANPRCIGCHEADYSLRTAAAGVDHVAFGFGEDCRSCHGTWRFSPADFGAHEACFQIARGPHAGISCRDCHDAGLPPMTAGAFSCGSDTADCLRCHSMPGIQAKHSGVAGFQPFNRRCYECHRFSGG